LRNKTAIPSLCTTSASDRYSFEVLARICRLGIRLKVFIAIPPASLARHGGLIKSDIVGRVDCSLPQLHSVIVKVALNMIRVVNIFHHIAVNGPVNHFPFCAGHRSFLLAGGNGFISLLLFVWSLFTFSLWAYQPFR
jgi:hypothetical protein